MKTIARWCLVMALLLVVFAPAPAQAAAGDYTFSVSPGTYEAITGATSTATGYDGAQNIALPFTFTYDGIDYTTARISVNGWLEMGQAYTGLGYQNDLASTDAKPLLAPLWDDLEDNTTSQISYTTLGVTPNRVFVVQWENILWPEGTSKSQNFQVRLYETTNVIEFVYGTMTAPGNNPSASIGINDATGGSGHFLSVTPAAGTADTASSTMADNTIASAVNLTSGKTYTFTPPDPNAPPACAINPGPAHGATNVLLSANLTWARGGGQVDGYRLSFGTDTPPTTLVNGTDVGNVTTYDPAGNLAANTAYYWQVVPYNANGGATGCPVWSFTTGSSVVLFEEKFTGATFPPTDWIVPAGGTCAWSRVTAGTCPTQAPYSAPAEAKFNSCSCEADDFKQLVSPTLDFSATGEYSLSFWMYHDTLYAGDFLDRLQVQVSLDWGSTFADVGAEIARYTGADGWAQHTVDLSGYAGQSAVNVVFKGISGWGSNMFLDDAQVIATIPVAPPNCAALVAPANAATGVGVGANLAWANGGGAPAGYRLAFGTDNPPTDIVNGADLGKVTTYNPAALLAGYTAHHWQIIPYNSFGPAVNCPVWSFTTGMGAIAAYPYVEGFEGGAAGWTSGGANSSWELGTPADAIIRGASTGANAWMTGLDSNYNNDEQSYVLSPIFDFSGLDDPYVKFDLWWDSEKGSDGAQLQASADGGATWEMVGWAWADPVFNWYNSGVARLADADGWSGSKVQDAGTGGYQASRGWRTALYSLADWAGKPEVRLRFFFGSDYSETYDGFAFDNFELRAGCDWTGATSDNWHTAGNWDCGHVPGAEEIAILWWDPVDPPPTPTIRADVTVAAVGAYHDLILASGNLTTRYVYEYGAVNIAGGYQVTLIGSGNAWEATWETQGDWLNPANGLVRFSGPGLQRIVHDYAEGFSPEAYAQFYDVVIENGAQVQSASNLQVVNDLTVNQGGVLDMGKFDLLVGGTLVNNGTLRQQQAVNGALAGFFDVGGYGGLMLDPGAQALGLTTVQIRGNQDCTTVAGETVKRCFDITPGSAPGSGVALTFYFAAAEIPVGQSCDTVGAYHWNGAWSGALTVIGRNCTVEPYSITIGGVTDFSPFVLQSGSAPNAVAVRAFAARTGLPGAGWIAALGALVAAGYRLTRRWQRRA